MIRKNIVIIPLIHDWNWTADFQRQTGLTLKKYQNTIIAYENHKEDINLKRLLFTKSQIVKKKGGIYFFMPFHLIPFERFDFIYQMNKKLSITILLLWTKIKFGFKRKIILWLFHPREVWILNIFKSILSNSFISVYDYLDYFAQGSLHEKKLLLKNEKELLTKADIVTAISKSFHSYIKRVRKNAVLVPQGFRLDDFIKTKKINVSFPKNKKLIGYVGGINNRLDFNILIPLVKNNPQWSFAFWGPVQYHLFEGDTKTASNLELLFSFPNVIRGKTSSKVLASIIDKFDVCIIPYDPSLTFNQYSYPMKIFEYFYCGKPTVSTPIKELKYYPKYIKIASNYKDWEKTIKTLLSRKWPKFLIREQKKLALDNTWDNKLSVISKLITSHPNYNEGF